MHCSGGNMECLLVLIGERGFRNNKHRITVFHNLITESEDTILLSKQGFQCLHDVFA